MSLVPSENGGYDLSSIGEKLKDPDLPYEHFAELCFQIGIVFAAVRQFDMKIKFMLGDAIVVGEMLYGEKAYQAFEELNVSEGVKQDCVRVARKIPRSYRRMRLTWSHHRAVASLEAPEQREWLRRASSEGLSHHALRDALRGSTAPHPAAGRAPCRCCGRGYGEGE